MLKNPLVLSLLGGVVLYFCRIPVPQFLRTPMGAIAGSWPLEEAAVRALLSGADLVMVCHDPEQIRRVHSAIARAIQAGKLPQDQVDESLYRILKAKGTL